MTNDQLSVNYQDIAGLATEIGKRIGTLVQDKKDGLAMVFAYEASRRLEEVMHRVNDICKVLAQQTDENVDRMVKKAIEDAGKDMQGKVIAFPGGDKNNG